MIAAPDGIPELVRAQDLDGDGAWEVFSGAPDDPAISIYSTVQRVYQVEQGETLNVIEAATDADNDALLIPSVMVRMQSFLVLAPPPAS